MDELNNKKNTALELKEGAVEGYCRVCGEYGKLTLDHIPPKSCGNNHKVTIRINDKPIISVNIHEVWQI